MSETRQFDAHVRLAEAGKAAALRGDHANALLRYRDAMRLAAEQQAPAVLRRHYLEISLESLELIEEFDSVLEYCDRAIAHYAEHPPQSDVASLDLATIHQRKGAVLMKTGAREAATRAFGQAIEIGTRIGARLELARLLQGWIARGLVVSADRITREQRRVRYFSVRSDTMGPAASAGVNSVAPAAHSQPT